MNTQKVFSCCIVFLLLSIAVVGATQDKSQRDLSSYADGGSYELTWAASGEEELEKIKEKVRNFIWDHWQHKRKGYIALQDATMYPEGPADSTVYNFYIEPNKEGVWQLTEEYGHFVSAELNGGKAANNKGVDTYWNVEMIKAGDVNDCPPLLSGSLELYPKHYRLRLTKSPQSKGTSDQPCVIL